MPIYEYKCQDCDHITEKLLRMSERPKHVECEKDGCTANAVRIPPTSFGYVNQKALWNTTFPDEPPPNEADYTHIGE